MVVLRTVATSSYSLQLKDGLTAEMTILRCKERSVNKEERPISERSNTVVRGNVIRHRQS